MFLILFFLPLCILYLFIYLYYYYYYYYYNYSCVIIIIIIEVFCEARWLSVCAESCSNPNSWSLPCNSICSLVSFLPNPNAWIPCLRFELFSLLLRLLPNPNFWFLGDSFYSSFFFGFVRSDKFFWFLICITEEERKKTVLWIPSPLHHLCESES